MLRPCSNSFLPISSTFNTCGSMPGLCNIHVAPSAPPVSNRITTMMVDALIVGLAADLLDRDEDRDDEYLEVVDMAIQVKIVSRARPKGAGVIDVDARVAIVPKTVEGP